MEFDPTSPVANTPPRHVDPWTRVEGHQVKKTAGGPLTWFCACGEQTREADDDWGKRHLENAWPILVPRLQGESLETWRSRLLAAIDGARTEVERFTLASRSDSGIPPGGHFPILSEGWADADDRLEVLEHQLAGRPFSLLAEV